MAKKEFTGVNVTTPICRLAFPALFEKRPKFGSTDESKGEYSVVMLFDKTQDLSVLKNAMLQAARNEFGTNVDLRSLDLKRIKDGDQPNSEGVQRPEFKGKWVIRAKTSLGQPGVVDASLNKIIDPAEIYSGVYAHVNVTAKAYTMPSKGVTFYLNHVQKVKDGEPFQKGAQAQDVFEELNLGADTQAPTQDKELDGMFG
jgi:hypothetical protein